MRISTLRIAAAVFCAALTAAPPAGATAMLTNLIVNPDAEADIGAADFGSTVAPSGWTTTSNFSAVQYAAGGLLDLNAADGVALGGGANYFAGGPNNGLSTARQSISLLDLSVSIDAGQITAALSALIGGFDNQADGIVIEAIFLDAGASALGTVAIGPSTLAARNNQSTLLAFSDNALVPVGTRSVDIVMTSTRFQGNYNDGYADNLSFVLRGGQDNPVPLPGTLALAALGLAACAARRSPRR